MEKDRRTDIPTENTKVEPKENNAVRVRKKSKLQQFTDSVISEDVADIKSYVKSEVVVPAIKKTISDIVSGVFDIIRNSVDSALFGEAPSKSRTSSSRTPYNSYYDGRHSNRKQYDSRQRSVFDYETLEYPTRGEAERVLYDLRECIREYKFASVFDLYDYSNLDAPTTSSNYGWADLSAAHVKYDRGAYIIKLPKALPRD